MIISIYNSKNGYDLNLPIISKPNQNKHYSLDLNVVEIDRTPKYTTKVD